MAVKRTPLTHAPDALEPEERNRVRAWALARWPRIGPQLGRHWGECRDWHLANGVMRASWEAAFRNWLRKASEIEGRPPVPFERRSPRREQRRASGEPSSLGSLLQGPWTVDPDDAA